MPDEDAPTGDPEDHVPDQSSEAQSPSVTQGGYQYEVVDESQPPSEPVAPQKAASSGPPWWALIAVAGLTGLLAAAVVWFIVGRDDRGSASTATAGSLLHAFTSGSEGVETRRFEGQFPPGYPESLPQYESAPVEASVLQIQGDGLGFIAVQHTNRSRDDVAAEMRVLYDTDPWQIDVGQDGREATLYQFKKIDDPDISGLVLLTASKDRSETTIITSVQLASGAEDIEDEPFVAVDGRPTPDGYPSEVPVYEGSIVIESAFQHDAQGASFAVSYIAQAEIDGVIGFYRDGLEEAGLTVEDGDASTSVLAEAQILTFTDEAGELAGEVAVGAFPLDDGYVQIDVQVGDQR